MVEKWILSGERLIGKGHEKDGLPCQDSVLTMERNGVFVTALSDGCSSAPLSEVGSKITVEALTSLFTERFDEIYALSEREIKNLIIDEIIDRNIAYVRVAENRQKILDTMKKKAPLYDDLMAKYNSAKTNEEKVFYLLVALDATVQAVAIKDEKIIFIRLGDGLIGEIKNGELKITSSEDKLNGIESNVTYYPTYFAMAEENTPAWELFEVIKGNNASEYDLIFIVCDGVADNIRSIQGKEQFIDPYDMDKILDMQEDLYSLLLSYKEGGESDDLSIVMLKSREPSYENVVIRECDENGKTINNEKLSTKEALLKEEEIIDDSFYTLFASADESYESDNTREQETIIEAEEKEFKKSKKEPKKEKAKEETEDVDSMLLEAEFTKNSWGEKTTKKIMDYVLKTSREDYLPFFLEQTSIIKEHLEKGGDRAFATVYDLIKGETEEDDFKLILEKSAVLGLFIVDRDEKTISKGALNE